ncbi:MAG: CHASE domain-containing protein [Magnetococcales bacterium]|nr:CHASE domain-containing protein [Magnetococcales bacterium]
MSNPSSPPHPYTAWLTRYGMVLLVVTCGIVFSLLTFYSVRLQITHHLRQEFEWVAEDRQRAVRKGLETATEAVYEMHDLFQATQAPIGAATFGRIATQIRARHPGTESLQWVTLNRNPETETATIIHIEPASARARQQGDDHFADSRLKRILNQARDTGQLTISGRVPLEETSPPQFGFLAIYPVYPIGATVTTVLERHNSLTGFIIGLFRFADLAKDAISLLEPRGVECMILDESAPEAERFLNFYSSRLAPTPYQFRDPLEWQLWLAQPGNRSFANTKLGNRTWNITCAQTSHFRSAEWFGSGDWITLVAGLVFTAWLAYYLLRIRNDLELRTVMAVQLQKSERLLSALFNQSPDLIRLVDGDGAVQLSNRPPAAGESDPAPTLLASDEKSRQPYLHALERAFSHRETNHFHYCSPENRWWEIRVVPLLEEARIVNAMVVATDISENKMLAEQASKNSRLASLGLMAAGVAHEINNPNNSIYYNATLLADSWSSIRPILDEYFREHGDFAIAGLPYAEMGSKLPKTITWIIENTERIKKIVGLLRHIASSESPGSREPLDLNRVIQSALQLLVTTIHNHTDHFSTHLPLRLPPVRGDAQQLEQVLINVLINALQSLPDRSRGVLLEARVDAENREVIFIIRDQGCGIHPAHLEKITEPFYTTRMEKGGTGLGLSISSTIIKNHGGRLRFESRLNTGTTLFIHLPVSGES